MTPPELITLDNGLRLIVAEDHAAPVVCSGFWFNVGSADEPPDRRGIADFIEHMMFRGFERIGPQEYARIVALLGGNCNVSTAPDCTIFHATIPSDGIEELLRMEADRLQRLKLTAQFADLERKVILEELFVYENQPMVRAMLAIEKEVCGDHPYATSPLGHRADLEALSVVDLERFYRRCYRPDRAVAVVCGDVERARIVDLMQRFFGEWRPVDSSPLPDLPVFRPKVGKLSLRLSVEVPIVSMMYGTGPLDEIDKPALDLLVAFLASGASSPIHEALVTKRRLCVAAGCMPILAARGGILAFFGAFLPPGRHAVRRAILKDLINGLAEHGPDPDRFEQHLKRFRKQRAGEGYSVEARMAGLGHAELAEGGFQKYERGLEELAKVTPQRIQSLARDLFAPANALELDVTPVHTPWWMVPAGLLLRIWPR